MIPASYFIQEGAGVRCQLCPHYCLIKDGHAGICGVRINENNILYSTNYEKVTSISIDPIEKKPLYHFYPGSKIFSAGSRGCNFHCQFCQNWQISQNPDAPADEIAPEELIRMVGEHHLDSIAYTYSEPTVWFEYVLACSKMAKAAGIKNVLVTNGYINEEPLRELLPYVDAMNIDLKTFSNDSYRRFITGSLNPVLKSIEIAQQMCHVELTTLVVTGMNDTEVELMKICDWIADINKNIPWHISRYYPAYKYNEPPSSVELITKVCEESRKKLSFVYCGNLPLDLPGSDTFCPKCGVKAVKRAGYSTSIVGLTNNGLCQSCGADLNFKLN